MKWITVLLIIFVIFSAGFESVLGQEVKPVPPVHFRNLKPFLPDFAGWEAGEIEGETFTYQKWSCSQVRRKYTKEDSSLSIEILDYAYIVDLYLPFQDFLKEGGFSRETEHELERSINLEGYPGWESYNRKDKDGELHLLVGNRFIIHISGSNITDPKTLRDFASAINLKKLEKMK